MAGGLDLGGPKGRTRSLDAAINLVPFIDLMAVTIVFLIMTAVWTQLGRLNVAQSGSAQGETRPDSQPPPSLFITERGLKLSAAGLDDALIPLTRDARGRLALERLTEQLGRIKAQQPEQAAITLLTDDAVAYEDLVRVIDTCIAAQFPSVSVSPASS